MALRHSDIDNLAPEDISLQFGPATLNEEIETWKDVLTASDSTVENFWMATAKRGFRQSLTSGAGRLNRLAAEQIARQYLRDLARIPSVRLTPVTTS